MAVIRPFFTDHHIFFQAGVLFSGFILHVHCQLRWFQHPPVQLPTPYKGLLKKNARDISHRINTRSEAIRRLLDEALKKYEAKPTE